MGCCRGMMSTMGVGERAGLGSAKGSHGLCRGVSGNWMRDRKEASHGGVCWRMWKMEEEG